MTDPIRFELRPPSLLWPFGHIEITPDIARQIVQMGHDEQTRFMREQTGQLVTADKPAPDCRKDVADAWRNCPILSDKMVNDIYHTALGQVLREQDQQQVGRVVSLAYHCGREKERRPVDTDQPAGDDAAVYACLAPIDALSATAQRIIRDSDMFDEDELDPIVEAHGEACKIVRDQIADLRVKLAATKTCYEAEIEKQQEDSAHWKQEYDGAMAANGRLATERDKALADLAAERAKLAAEEKTVDDALAEVERTEERFTEIAEMFDPDWEWSNLRTQSVAMDLIRDHLNAHDVVKAERDRLAARVAELERERDTFASAFEAREEEARKNFGDVIDAPVLRQERDKALADLAAEQTAHVNTGARCAALGHTLDAMTERAEKAERGLTAARILRPTAAPAIVSSEQGNYIHNLESERDAARAEIDALRTELAAVSDAIGTCSFMDPPDGGSPTLAEQVRRMRKALDESDAVGKSNYQALKMAQANLHCERLRVATWHDDATRLAAERDALKARKVTWTPETCRQVINRTTSLVEFIEQRDGPDGGVTMPVHDVVILRDLARAAGVEVV